MEKRQPDQLRRLIEIIADLAEIKDLDILMERILTIAREFVRSDAGSIYIREKDTLQFSYTQNDTLSKRLKPGEKLIYSTFSIPIDSNSIAGHAAVTGETLVIDDAYTLPAEEPYSFDKSFDTAADYRTCSMLTVPLKTVNGNVIGILQLINRLGADGSITTYDDEDKLYVTYFATNAASALERAQLMRKVLLRMIRMAELRDPKETGNHVNRVAGYAVEIYETWARSKGVSEEEIFKTRDVLRMAAMLHDVGKVAISDTILKKPARLNDEEYEIMKQHTVLGARLFGNASSDFEKAAMDVALNHHERYDGTGYPGYVDPMNGDVSRPDENGRPVLKRGEEISLFGRIVALADVYDALSSRRSYKEPWSDEKVRSIIEEERGGHFDPEIVDAFYASYQQIKAIGDRYVDEPAT